MTAVAIVILLIVFALAGWLWLKKRNRTPQAPRYPGELPILGHALQLLGGGTRLWNTLEQIGYYSLEHGGIVVLRMGSHEWYVVTDPNDCATVTSTCYDKPYLYEFMKPVIGESLLTSKGTTLGLDSDDVITEHYAENMDKIMHLILDRILKNPFLLLPCIYNISKNKKLQEECLEKIISITNNIIRDRKRELNKPVAVNAEAKTFLDVMIKQGSFTNSKLREHADFMIVANYDTIYHALKFTLLLIGSHKKVQERIYNELQDVFEASETYVDKNELSKLVYLEAVIKESMRIYPPVPIVGRQVDKDVKLRNYVIPKGSTFLMFIHGMHRHPMWGADVDQFRPERWLEPGGVPENNKAYAPFSLGKRNCIGKQYAMNLMKIYLAHIIRKYRVTANIDEVVLMYEILITPSSGHELMLDPRTH